MKSIVCAKQFDKSYLEKIFVLAKQAEERNHAYFGNIFPRMVLMNLFYEPSTRTRTSFSMAAIQLGIERMETEAAGHFSSAAKGETLHDTIRTISSMKPPPSVIVLRHPEDGSAEIAAEVSESYGIPLINAGDGGNQHPTQALLDLYTIKEEKGRLDNLHVVVGGDLLKGRTVHSLIYLLTKYNDIRFTLIAPGQLQLKPGLIEYLREHEVPFIKRDTIEGNIGDADVIYWTRYQTGRHEGNAPATELIIRGENCEEMKKDAIIMHPLPRIKEIAVEVDKDPRARYFPQSGNGVPVRIALLQNLLG